MLLLMILLAQATALPPATPSPPACTAPEHRQFDFWVGYWDVYRTGTDTLAAHSLIEKLYDGCALRENWMPLKGEGGGSLNSYIPDEELWRQVWVDSPNSWGTFEGTLQDGAMILSGTWKNVNGPGTSAFVRTSWVRNPDGSVRQFGDSRDADGKSWSRAFDFTYKVSKSPPPK